MCNARYSCIANRESAEAAAVVVECGVRKNYKDRKAPIQITEAIAS